MRGEDKRGSFAPTISGPCYRPAATVCWAGMKSSRVTKTPRADAAGPQAKTISLRGLTFRYYEWGQADHPSMLLLHGGAERALSWERFAALQAGQFRVIALEQRGHGESDWSDSYYPTECAADIAACIKSLGLAPVVLVGYSMGGRHAILCSAAQPALVRALVIEDYGAYLEGDEVERTSILYRDPQRVPEREEFRRRLKEYNPSFADEQIERIMTKNLRQWPDGRWSWHYDIRCLQQARAFITGQQPLWRQMVSHVQTPTLIVRGKDSKMISHESAALLRQLIKDSELVEEPGGNHHLHRYMPDALDRVVREFLARRAEPSLPLTSL